MQLVDDVYVTIYTHGYGYHICWKAFFHFFVLSYGQKYFLFLQVTLDKIWEKVYNENIMLYFKEIGYERKKSF